MLGIWVDCDQLELYTDAAAGIGFGAFFQGQWALGTWPDHWINQGPDITFKKLFPIVLSLQLWASQLQNKKVIFFCDNQAVVQIINKQSTRSPPSMRLLRLLVLACLRNNIVCRAKHIPGRSNIIADALSRGQLSKFQALAPDAESEPTPIPDTLLQQLQQK